MPEVSSAEIIKDNLKSNYEIPGDVRLDFNQYDYAAASDFSEVKVLVSNGQTVKPGTPLYSVDINDFYLTERQLLIELLDLRMQNEMLAQQKPDDKDVSERNRLQYEINKYDIETIKKSLDEINEIKSKNGTVYSKDEGIVSYSIQNEAPVKKSGVIISIKQYKETGSLSWQMPENSAKDFSIGDSISVPLTILSAQVKDQPPVSKTVYFNLKIESKTYMEQSGAFLFCIKLTPKVLKAALNMSDGQKAMVKLNYITSSQYDYVIPKDAINSESSDSGYVFQIKKRKKIYGEEYYVAVTNVTVINQSETNAALEGIDKRYPIATSNIKKLEDGMAVRLK